MTSLYVCAPRYAEELYNHTGDHSFEMDAYENINAAKSNPTLAAALHKQLVEFFGLHSYAKKAGEDERVGATPDRSDPYDN